MARYRAEFAGPDFRPDDAQYNCERANQEMWDTLNTPYPTNGSGMAYLDRVGPEMFVGRYDHGTCPTIPKEAAEHAKHMDIPKQNIFPVKKRYHAYILTITPKGAKSVCLYCGATMKGCPGSKAKPGNATWDEPWEKPRRANARELEAMDISQIPENHLLYLDKVDGSVHAGRMRIGECTEGGPHEVVVHWWRRDKDPRLSMCVFCHQQWTGAPPGFWELLEPNNTVERVLAEHAEDVRRGLY